MVDIVPLNLVMFSGNYAELTTIIESGEAGWGTTRLALGVHGAWWSNTEILIIYRCCYWKNVPAGPMAVRHKLMRHSLAERDAIQQLGSFSNRLSIQILELIADFERAGIAWNSHEFIASFIKPLDNCVFTRCYGSC